MLAELYGERRGNRNGCFLRRVVVRHLDAVRPYPIHDLGAIECAQIRNRLGIDRGALQRARLNEIGGQTGKMPQDSRCSGAEDQRQQQHRTLINDVGAGPARFL